MPRPGLLPGFKDGLPLSARDMNRIADVEVFLHGINAFMNVPMRIAEEDDVRHLIHRYQNLRWIVAATAAATLVINGVDGPSAATVSNGMVDLDSDGANPYGLTLGKPYTLEWKHDPVLGLDLYETISSDDLIVLPEAVPLWALGDRVTAAELNAIAANLQYLMNLRADRPVRPFLQESLPLRTDMPDVVRYYKFINVNQFLFIYIRAERRGADGSQNWRLRVEIDKGVGYVLVYDYEFPLIDVAINAWRTISLGFDMWGTAHENHSGFSTILTPVPTVGVGDGYRVRLTMRGEMDSYARVMFVVELPKGNLF